MPTSCFHGAKVLHRELDREIERLRAQTLLSWNKEARNLEWFGLRDGMSVLELGSGPGFVTEQLLILLPASPITAVEIDATVLEMAQRRLDGKYGERLHFVNRSVTGTDLPANSFDFAIARLIFQHLPDPICAAREVFRVLRPGGKLVITDIDDALWGLSDPAIQKLNLMMEKYGQAQAAGGGNRFVGRGLCRILESSDFTNRCFEAVAVHSDLLGIEAFLTLFDPDRLLLLVEAGLISTNELRQFRASREKFLAASRPLLLMILLMACGEKPSPTGMPISVRPQQP